MKKYFSELRKIPIKDNIGLRLDKYVFENYDISWPVLQKFFRKKDIYILRKDIRIKDPSEKLQLNDYVCFSDVFRYGKRIISINSTKNSVLKLSLNQEQSLLSLFKKMKVFSTSEFIILNKVCNIASQNGTNINFSLDTILSLKNKINGNLDLKLIHRLDKNVTGLMIVGKDINFVRKIGDDMKNSKIDKVYLTMTQNFPIYLKHMISNNKIDLFDKSLSGVIKSNENCDKHILELSSGYNIISDDNVKITRNVLNYKNIEEFTHIGKFKITHFIYYDRNKKKYEILNNKDIINKLSFEDEKRNIECFTLLLYELVTGKKHQIRKQLSRCFMSPIFNDEEYLFQKGNSIYTYRDYLNNLKYNETCSQLIKHNINNYLYSIFLHSIQLKLPYKISKYDSKNVMVKDIEDETFIKNIILPYNFQTMIDLFNDKKIESYFTNRDEILKI